MIWILFFVTFVMSWAIARYVRRRAISIYQKKHTVPQADVRILPEGAGLAIVLTWVLSCSYLYLCTDFMPFELVVSMAPGLALLGVLVLDDMNRMPKLARFVAVALSVAVGLFLQGGVNTLVIGDFTWSGPVAKIVMNAVAFVLLTWLVFVFRAYDGVDGKEGNLATVVLTICVMSIVVAKKNPMFFLIPCVAGFLVRNWHPARYLLGHASASFLGYLVGMFAVYFQSESVVEQGGGIPFTVFMLMSFVPVFDVTYTCIRRRLQGADFSKLSKTHLYQRLFYSGFSHTKVIISQVVLCALMLVLALVDDYFHNAQVSLFLIGDAFLIMGFYALWVENLYPFVPEKSEDK